MAKELIDDEEYDRDELIDIIVDFLESEDKLIVIHFMILYYNHEMYLLYDLIFTSTHFLIN